jgi:hypothetical protein
MSGVALRNARSSAHPERSIALDALWGALDALRGALGAFESSSKPRAKSPHVP